MESGGENIRALYIDVALFHTMLSIGVVVMKLCGPDKYSLLIVLFQTPVGIAVSARMLILFVSVYVCDLCVR